MQKAAVQKARVVFAKRPQRIQRLELVENPKNTWIREH